MLTTLLLLQAVAGPPVPRELRAPRVAQPCPTEAAEGEILVCGRPADPPRLAELPPEAEAPPADPLAFRLPGGGRGRVHAIQSSVGGFTGQGAAVSVAIPLGRRPRKPAP